MGKGIWLAIMAVLWALATPAGATEDNAAARTEPVALKIANRTLITFHASLLGESPEIRAQRAESVIRQVMENQEDPRVHLDSIKDNYLVLVGQRRAFIVTPEDLGDSDGSAADLADSAAARLRQVLVENHEAHNLQFMLKAAGFSAAASLLYFALLRLLGWCHKRLLGWLPTSVSRHTGVLRVGQTQLLDTGNLVMVSRRLVDLLYWLLALLLSYEWLSFVLRRFPYTRPWGESLNQYMLDMAGYLLQAMVSGIPGLVIALLIFFIARGISAFSKRLLTRLARPGNINWLNAETLPPTTRLTSLAIWLFALAMAYPYLPGAGTEAFKGLSVLIGLMISLGATSVVGQAAAGLILTYTRTLRPGEFVRIGEHEGTVTELGMFTTSIRTGLGEVLTIPNSMITGTVTKNYSRVVQGSGYVVDATVTIGYDTPWRQVEAILLEAARRTPGVLDTPRPQVFQTALSDFYPEYRLVAQAVPSAPRPRAELLSMLYANIQDVFNEYGVQMMSPHYMSDPAHEKRVPRERWYAAPAQAPASPQEPE